MTYERTANGGPLYTPEEVEGFRRSHERTLPRWRRAVLWIKRNVVAW